MSEADETYKIEFCFDERIGDSVAVSEKEKNNIIKVIEEHRAKKTSNDDTKNATYVININDVNLIVNIIKM